MADLADDGLELLAFLAKLLGAFRVVPDVWRLEQARDLGQTSGLGIEVKDTPEAR